MAKKAAATKPTIEKINLVELNSIVQRMLPFTDDKQLLSYEFLHVIGKQVRASAGAISATWNLPWDLGNITLPAKRTGALLSSLIDRGHTEIEVKPQENATVIKTGRSVSRLPFLPATEVGEAKFLKRSEPETGRVKLDDTFWLRVAQVETAMSQVASDYFIRGVYWGSDGSLAASDRNRIAICAPIAGAAKCPLKDGVLIPAFFLESLTSRNDYKQISFEPSFLWLFADQGYVSATLQEAIFPFPLVAGKVKEMSDALKGATEVTLPDAGEAIIKILDGHLNFTDAKESFAVQLAIADDGWITLLVEQTATSAASEDAFRAKAISGKGMTLRCNGLHLRDALRISSTFRCKEGEPIMFSNPTTQYLVQQVYQTTNA